MFDIHIIVVNLRKSIEKVRVVFLYWLPCILRMSRPQRDEEEEKFDKKAQQLQSVELKDRYDGFNIIIWSYIIHLMAFWPNKMLLYGRFVQEALQQRHHINQVNSNALSS